MKTETESDEGELTVDQGRESREEQSHRVPHPDGDKQQRRGEAPDDGSGKRGRGRIGSGNCRKSWCLIPGSIRRKERERVREEAEEGMVAVCAFALSPLLCLPGRRD